MVGVLAHQALQAEVVGELLGVVLEVQDDLGAVGLALDLGNGELALTLGAPLHALALVAARLAGAHRHLVGDDEARIEAHPELADQPGVLLLLAGELLEEFGGAASGDGAEVGDHFLTAHADAVVAHGHGAGLGVVIDLDAQLAVAFIQGVVVQCRIAQLVAGVGGVGDQLAQEDLPVGVQGVNHQVQQLLDLGLEAEGFLAGGSGHGPFTSWLEPAATPEWRRPITTGQRYGGRCDNFKRRVPAGPARSAAAPWPPAPTPAPARR